MASDDEEPYFSDDSDYPTEEYDVPDSPVRNSQEEQVFPSYTILSQKDIQQRQEGDIERVSSTLPLPASSLTLLLYHHNWDVEKVTNNWFEDEARVREAVGLLDMESTGTTEAESGERYCGICLETVSTDTMRAAACCHDYCATCWRGYIACSINDGPGCLSLRCPYPSYHAAVDTDMIESLSTKEDHDKYRGFLVRSYVEGKKNMKWCPSPGCEYAVELTEVDRCDVKCRCSYFFCWGCTEEVHRPVKCETVAKWAEKNQSDGENTKWLLANSKPCPKCKRFIEKNDGCMHMTCTPPCRFEFCWLCMGNWKKHGDKTGGFYACNSYEVGKLEGRYNEEETTKENAKQSLFRYTHYFERWNGNHHSMVNAMEKLRDMKNGELEKLTCMLYGAMAVRVEFITEAWEQIVECRRVLKWSYAYGYFLPEYETVKKMLFEDLQGQAESDLERLHDCAENQYKQWLKNEENIDPEEFMDFKDKLVNLTDMTKVHFKNLVQGFESGLNEVICERDDPGSSSSAMHLLFESLEL